MPAAVHSTSLIAPLRALQAEAREGALRVRVAGGCMAPELADGSVVEIETARLPLPGDIVAFVAKDGRLTVHRLLGYLPPRGGQPWRCLTQADASLDVDAPFPRAALLGRVRRVPVRHRFAALRLAGRRYGAFVARRLAQSWR